MACMALTHKKSPFEPCMKSLPGFLNLPSSTANAIILADNDDPYQHQPHPPLIFQWAEINSTHVPPSTLSTDDNPLITSHHLSQLTIQSNGWNNNGHQPLNQSRPLHWYCPVPLLQSSSACPLSGNEGSLKSKLKEFDAVNKKTPQSTQPSTTSSHHKTF